jgi:hypothetical protein
LTQFSGGVQRFRRRKDWPPASYRFRLGFFALQGLLAGCASVSPLGIDFWQEEVFLHDGRRIIVTRTQTYGGRHEIGQPAPVKEHVLRFRLPDGPSFRWVSEYGEDIGRTNFNPLAIVADGMTPFVVAEPNLCLSYNKWGRPNPPYVVFKHDGDDWRRVDLAELPVAARQINLIAVPWLKDVYRLVEERGHVPAATITQLNARLPQPEFKTILRDAIPNAWRECEELIRYKGHWIMPNDPVGRRIVDMKN